MNLKENPITKKLILTSLQGTFSIIQIDPAKGIPEWAQKSEFFSITQTNDELSIVCEDTNIPDNINREKKWRVLKIEGLFNFDEIGILNSITTPLAQANISLLAISTFNTDYILIQESHFAEVVDILINEGHEVR